MYMPYEYGYVKPLNHYITFHCVMLIVVHDVDDDDANDDDDDDDDVVIVVAMHCYIGGMILLHFILMFSDQSTVRLNYVCFCE